MKLHKPDDDYDDVDDAFDDLIGHALGLIATPGQNIGKFAQLDHPNPRDAKISRIRCSLDLLCDDGFEPRGETEMKPPSDLCGRTLDRIRQKEAIAREFREPLQYQPRWRLTDLAVAAAVLFAAFLGSLPALKNGKATAANLACSANLAQIWKGFEQYSTVFNAYPNAAVDNRRLPVGATLMLLRHTGHLDPTVPLTCPGCSSRMKAGELPAWHQFSDRSDAAIHQLSTMMDGVYALHPGLKVPSGVRHLERAMIDTMRSIIPLAGDAPPMSNRRVVSGNSPAHGGLGQNVIFADGHAVFFRSRAMRSFDRDIYSNRMGHSSAALDPFDMILIPAPLSPNAD